MSLKKDSMVSETPFSKPAKVGVEKPPRSTSSYCSYDKAQALFISHRCVAPSSNLHEKEIKILIFPVNILLEAKIFNPKIRRIHSRAPRRNKVYQELVYTSGGAFNN